MGGHSVQVDPNFNPNQTELKFLFDFMFDSDYQLIKPICFTISKTVRFIFWGPGGMLKLTKYIYIKKKPKTKSPNPIETKG